MRKIKRCVPSLQMSPEHAAMISEMNVCIGSDRTAMHMERCINNSVFSYCNVDITKCSNLPINTIASECTPLFTPDRCDVSVYLYICAQVIHHFVLWSCRSVASANCNQKFIYTLGLFNYITYSEKWTQTICQGNILHFAEHTSICCNVVYWTS